jgi:hypothetical protein
MRRRTLLGIPTLTFATFLAAGLGGFAFSETASAATVWSGEVVVIAAGSQCRNPSDERRNIDVGTVLKSVFRPRRIDDNGADTLISFSHDAGAVFVMDVGFARPNGKYSRLGVTYSAVGPTNLLRDYTSLQIVPVNVSATTEIVRISGNVEDFMFIPGCTVTFRAAYVRRD